MTLSREFWLESLTTNTDFPGGGSQVVRGAAAPVHAPTWHSSSEVQMLPSSQGVPSARSGPTHDSALHVSAPVQKLPSSHGLPSFGKLPTMAVNVVAVT